MAGFGPKSVRGRTVLVTVLASAVAMTAIVGIVGAAMFSALRSAVLATLEDRLDVAESYVAAGDFETATDSSGTVFVAVLDQAGQVVASNSDTVEEFDLKGLLDELGSDDIDLDDDDLERHRNKDEEQPAESSGGSSSGSSSSSGGGSSSGSGGSSGGGSSPSPAPAPAPVDDDDDDDYDDDRDDDSDDDDDDDDDNDLADIIRHPFLNAIPSRLLAAATVSEAEAAKLVGGEGPFLIGQRQVAFEGDLYTIVAISSISEAIQAARSAAMRLGAIFALLLVAIAAFTWVMSGKTLEPVERMRADAEAIMSGRLSSRIDVPADDPDLAPLASTFNAVIARLEADLAAQQRFISDASHELKSPVAASAVILETLAANPDAVKSEQALTDLARENARMSSIVSDLLALARYDEGRGGAELAPCDLIDVISEQVAPIRTRSSKSFDLTRVEPVVARVDERLVGHALRNLLENAERFAKSRVAVSCVERGSWLQIAVSDDGPGIDVQDRERVFGRFVRLDQTAEAAGSSTGLGLAVVRSVAQAHGGRAFFADGALGGATAVLELPL